MIRKLEVSVELKSKSSFLGSTQWVGLNANNGSLNACWMRDNRNDKASGGVRNAFSNFNFEQPQLTFSSKTGWLWAMIVDRLGGGGRLTFVKWTDMTRLKAHCLDHTFLESWCRFMVAFTQTRLVQTTRQVTLVWIRHSDGKFTWFS